MQEGLLIIEDMFCGCTSDRSGSLLEELLLSNYNNVILVLLSYFYTPMTSCNAVCKICSIVYKNAFDIIVTVQYKSTNKAEAHPAPLRVYDSASEIAVGASQSILPFSVRVMTLSGVLWTSTRQHHEK